MNKQLILIRYGELGLKGKNRHIFVNKLANNIRASDERVVWLAGSHYLGQAIAGDRRAAKPMLL